LITGLGANLTRTLTTAPGPNTVISYGSRLLIIVGNPETQISMPCVLLTKVGKEVATILSPPFNMDRAKELVNLIPKGNLQEIAIGITQGDRFLKQEVLWKADP